MQTLKLLIKNEFKKNKINDFLCFDIIKYIFNRRNNKVLISYIIKINTFNQDVLPCRMQRIHEAIVGATGCADRKTSNRRRNRRSNRLRRRLQQVIW